MEQVQDRPGAEATLHGGRQLCALSSMVVGLHAVQKTGQLAGAGLSQMLGLCAPITASRLKPLLRLCLSARAGVPDKVLTTILHKLS